MGRSFEEVFISILIAGEGTRIKKVFFRVYLKNGKKINFLHVFVGHIVGHTIVKTASKYYDEECVSAQLLF